MGEQRKAMPKGLANYRDQLVDNGRVPLPQMFLF